MRECLKTQWMRGSQEGSHGAGYFDSVDELCQLQVCAFIDL